MEVDRTKGGNAEMKKLLAIAAALLMLLAAACNNNPADPEPEPDPEFPVTVGSVTLTEAPRGGLPFARHHRDGV